MKIIHTADWHIDANLIEAGRCLQHLCKKAVEIQPDLVIVAGDMFNSADVRLDSDAARLAMSTIISLKNNSKHGVVILIGTPSHDGLAAMIFDGIDKVIVASAPNSIFFHPIDEPYESFVVSVLPQPTKQFLESRIEGDIEDVDLAMSEALTAICAGFGSAASESIGPHICVGHFSVKGAKISPTQQMIGYDIQLSLDQLDLAQADLWCLGHIHHSQCLAPGVFYSGSIYRVDFGERESEKGFMVHELAPPEPEVGVSGYGIDTVLEPTPASTMNKIAYETTGIDAGDDIGFDTDWPDIADKMQVEVKCYDDQTPSIDTEALKKALLARGAGEVDIIIQRIPRPNVRSAKILAVEALRDKLIARAELTDDELEPGILEKADLIETMKAEAVLNIIQKQFTKGGSANETN